MNMRYFANTALFASVLLMVLALPVRSAHAQACAKPNLLLVLDKSCSMGSGATSKWGYATAAINTATTQFNGKLTFGLEVFDSSASIAYGINTCFGAGAGCVSALQTRLRSYSAGGGTNLIGAMTTASSHISSLSATLKSRKTSVMFLTDGQSTCANTQVQQLLATLGVKTYVIGFGTGVTPACLNSMAVAGATALAGTRKYYQANNKAELDAALKAIANAASTEVCNNKDDNCNGVIDENLKRNCNGPCGAGTETCKAGKWQTCSTARQPKTEICNNIDDDCNGVIDNGLKRKCSNACGTGDETCSKGKWGGCTAPTVKTETCNNADDDCDGKVDGIQRPCSTVCGKGNETCVAGKWDFCDAQKPVAETCDNKDNNCEGTIDEGLTRSCNSKCGPGTETCKAGQWVECTGPQPKAEVCDGVDNNCDGKVDEGISRDCTSKCGAGKEYCNNGSWENCDARKPTAEVCNNLDDDCDGKSDNMPGDDPKCPVCRTGVCLRNCTQECPRGFECKEGACVETPCRRIKCGNTETCKDGKCVDVCKDIKCKTNEACVAGQCLPTDNKDCTTLGCPSGQKCIEKKCVSDPCSGVKCEGREFCREGKCVGSCANITCGTGSYCQDGKCIENTDPCASLNCKSTQICKDGKCIDLKDHPCAGVKCDQNQYCDDGKCIDDPCKDIVCPGSNTCHRGQCYGGTNPPPKDPVFPNPDPSDGSQEENPVIDAGSPDTVVGKPDDTVPPKNIEDGNIDGGTTGDSGPTRPPQPVGCPCSIGEDASLNGIPVSMILLLFAFMASLRRRRS